MKPLRFPAAALALLLCSGSARATWSILVYDTRTHEVAIGTATCIANDDLLKWVPVVVVGKGGGVAQGGSDIGSDARRVMYEEILAGNLTPQEILQSIIPWIGFPTTRQFGVASGTGDPASFSGSWLGDYVGVRKGIAGDLRYVVLGNVLAGPGVVASAEAALLNTPGDLSQRVMAAMEAARDWGGDGRCSCSDFAPDSCGSPPPSFEKAAHVAYVITARVGDADGGCLWPEGCALGNYYLELQVTGPTSAPDPVPLLRGLYETWRTGLSGRPDHLLSKVGSDATRLVADGLSATTVRIELVDVDGVALSGGGASIGIATADGAPPHVTPGPAVDHGDGTYELTLTAGTTPGNDAFVITVDDGIGPVTLFPFLDMTVDPPASLHVGVEEVSVTRGGIAPFVVNLGPGAAGHPYILLGSLSGTSPGVSLGGGVVLPLNQDVFMNTTIRRAGSTVLPGTIGVLDGGGRTEAALDLPAGFAVGIVGLHSDWAAIDYGGPFDVTDVVGLDFVL